MDALNSCHQPGILVVTGTPKSPDYLPAIHHWYNTEHGPARLQLGRKFFSNGYRYKTCHADPKWFAIYDMERLSAGADPRYTVLREHRSSREQDIFRSKLKVHSRQFLKTISSRGSISRPASQIVFTTFSVSPEMSSTVKKLYEQTIFPQASHIRGWRRSRLFELVDGTGDLLEGVNFLALHDFDDYASLDNVSHVLELPTLAVLQQRQETTEFYHEFHAEDYRPPPLTILDITPLSCIQDPSTIHRRIVAPT